MPWNWDEIVLLRLNYLDISWYSFWFISAINIDDLSPTFWRLSLSFVPYYLYFSLTSLNFWLQTPLISLSWFLWFPYAFLPSCYLSSLVLFGKIVRSSFENASSEATKTVLNCSFVPVDCFLTWVFWGSSKESRRSNVVQEF